MNKKAFACISSLFFYLWILHIADIIAHQALTTLIVVLPVILGGISLAGATFTLTSVMGKRKLLTLPLIFILGIIVATSFLSVPLGIESLIGRSGLIPAAWTVSFLLMAPCSSIFFLSLPKNKVTAQIASVISAIISIFALLILLLIGPGLLSGHSVIHLLALLWLYGIIGLPIIGILFVITALYNREGNPVSMSKA